MYSARNQKQSIICLLIVTMHVKYICNWIAGYYIFNFDCATISNLWDIDNYIPMKDTNMVEIIRGAVLWCI